MELHVLLTSKKNIYEPHNIGRRLEIHFHLCLYAMPYNIRLSDFYKTFKSNRNTKKTIENKTGDKHLKLMKFNILSTFILLYI